MARVILYALIAGLIGCHMTWGKAVSVKWTPVKEDGRKCHQCEIYARCVRVLKGAHKAEAKRIWEAHRVVCPNGKRYGRRAGK